MALWKDGRTTGFTFEGAFEFTLAEDALTQGLTPSTLCTDLRSKLKWTIFMALCAVFYHALVAYLG